MTVKNGEMAVKFYYNGQKYGVSFTEGDYANIAPVLALICVREKMNLKGVSNLVCYHSDGQVEPLVPIYNPNGELVNVGRRIDE